MTLQRTGRAIVYTNQVPWESDVLRTNMYKMADISKLAETILGIGTGNSTKVSGGACTATGPASLAVNVAPITIYQEEDYDATDYGVIPADTDNVLYKQGINLDTTLVSGFTAPVSPGTNYYLIQAEIDTNDENDISRPYYDSDIPAEPIFESKPDTRVDSVLISKKVSLVSTPSPDAGNVGLYAITVAFGQSTITSGDITPYSTTEGAPFITESLTQKLSAVSAALLFVTKAQVQNGTLIYASAGGSANAITATYSPAIASQPAGQGIRLKSTATNTTSATIAVNGLSANTIKKNTYSGLVNLSGGEIVSGGMYDFIHNGTNYELINPTPMPGAEITPGMSIVYRGGTVKDGYLLEDGASYLRSAYPALFAEIGTLYGAADGTHFNVPNSQVMVDIGSGGTSLVGIGTTTGSTGGDQTSAALLAHTHTINDAGHHHNNSTRGGAPVGGPNPMAEGTGGSLASIQTGDSTTGITINSSGSGSSFSLMQPVLVATKMIKY